MEKQMNFPILVELDEDNVFIVSCPLLKGCHSYGHTIDEAMSNIREVIEMCIEEEDTQTVSKNQYIGFREISLTPITNMTA